MHYIDGEVAVMVDEKVRIGIGIEMNE